ncbi:hypothetical protein PPL_07646 [Heterostelium album PN500]|uniref:Ankyrin repeat protein n=1 Tax=Heterostelium pallidum (strain ATCC 26659 / Pp 5 / PN500) TaxID=670386 RepID=D3BGJ4_HETP5|nr:hypothetical protein PPL_07646 [Heterostelium album PN500]EFA79228.1 hypothetical protein PPL_07646 [Heterostelium album PN500]|eukprot:XP_020431349.1 hypothetical protein PPL_07646 [Heterostelium album PN500]
MNKQLFLRLFNNKTLFYIIFNYANYIFKIVLKKNIVFKWNKVILSPSILAGNGYLELLKHYANEHRYSIIYNAYSVLNNSIIANHLNIIKYLCEDLKVDSLAKDDKDNLFRLASRFSRLQIIRYLVEVWNIDLDYYAAFIESPLSGDITIVKYLSEQIAVADIKQNRYPKTVFEMAAKSGDVNILEWLYSNQSVCHTAGWGSVYHSAIEGGHLPMVEYLLERNNHNNNINNNIKQSLELDSYLQQTRKYIIDFGIEKDKLEIVKLLHSVWFKNQNKEFKSNNAYKFAINNGNCEMLEWLEENVGGFTSSSVNSETLNIAAAKGRLDLVKWIYGRCGEQCFNSNNDREFSALDFAAANGHFELVIWMNENINFGGCSSPSTNAIDYASKGGYLEIIQYLHNNRYCCSEKAMDNAAKYNQFDTLKWLHLNRSEGCTTNAMDSAAKSNHINIVKWLHENRSEGCTTNAIDKPSLRSDGIT